MKSQLRNGQNDTISQKQESSTPLAIKNVNILAKTHYNQVEKQSQAFSSDIESSVTPESLINKAEVLQNQVEVLNKELALVQRLITHRREKEKLKAQQKKDTRGKQNRGVFKKGIQGLQSETSESDVTAQNIPGQGHIVHENSNQLSIKVTSDQSQSGITQQIGDYSYQHMRRNQPRDTFGKQSIGNSDDTYSIKQNTQQIQHHHEISFAADQRSQNVHTASHQNSTRRVIQQESLLSYDQGSQERKVDCKIDETDNSLTSQKQTTLKISSKKQNCQTGQSLLSVNSNTKQTILLKGINNIGKAEIKESTQHTIISQLVIEAEDKIIKNGQRIQTENSPTHSDEESQQSDGPPKQPHFPYQSTENLVKNHNSQPLTADPTVNYNQFAIGVVFDLVDRQRFSKSVSENKEEIDASTSNFNLSHLNKQLQITDNMLSHESINQGGDELVQIYSAHELSSKKSTQGLFDTKKKNEMEISKRFDGLGKLVAEIDQTPKSPYLLPPSPSVNTNNIRIQEDMYSSRNDIQVKPHLDQAPLQFIGTNFDRSSFIQKIKKQQKIEVGVVELQINTPKEITPKQQFVNQQLSTGQKSNIFEKSGNATRQALSNIQEAKAEEISSIGKITHTQKSSGKQEDNLPADAFNKLNPKAPNVNNFPSPKIFNQDGEIINLNDRIPQTLQDFLDKAISPAIEMQIQQNVTPKQQINQIEIQTINKQPELRQVREHTDHINPLKTQVKINNERSPNLQRQPSKSDPIPKQLSPQKTRYNSDNERQQSQQQNIQTHTKNQSTSDPIPTQPQIKDEPLPQQPIVKTSVLLQAYQEARPSNSIAHITAKPVEQDETEPNLPNVESILPSHMPLRSSRRDVFEMAEQGPLNIQLNQGYQNHFRTLPHDKSNEASKKYIQTTQDDYSDGANVHTTNQRQIIQKPRPQIRHPPKQQDVHDLYQNQRQTINNTNHRSVHQQSTSRERSDSKHYSNERQILETMQTNENLKHDTSNMNLLPINFVQVDANTIDPTQQYFILEGKIGALQFPQSHRAPSTLFKEQRVNNFVLPTVRSKPNLNSNALPQLNSLERQTNRTPPRIIRQQLNTGSAFVRKSNSHQVNMDTPLTKAAQIYATAYNPSTGITKGSGRIRDQIYYPLGVEQVNYDSQMSTQSKEIPMPPRRRIKQITASPKPAQKNPEIENADSSVRSLIEEFEQRSSSGDPKAGLTLHKLRLHHPLFSKLSINGFKYMVENSYIFKLKPGQFIYRQHASAAPNLYFILFGSFVCQTKQAGQFGSIMCVGHTLGEEVIFAGDGTNEVYRTESVVSQDFSCVLQINVKTMQLMRLQRHVGAGGGNLSKDFGILDYILESHYLQKSEWRVSVGADSEKRSIEKESRLSQQNILLSERITSRRGKSEAKTGRRN